MKWHQHGARVDFLTEPTSFATLTLADLRATLRALGVEPGDESGRSLVYQLRRRVATPTAQLEAPRAVVLPSDDLSLVSELQQNIVSSASSQHVVTRSSARLSAPAPVPDPLNPSGSPMSWDEALAIYYKAKRSGGRNFNAMFLCDKSGSQAGSIAGLCLVVSGSSLMREKSNGTLGLTHWNYRPYTPQHGMAGQDRSKLRLQDQKKVVQVYRSEVDWSTVEWVQRGASRKLTPQIAGGAELSTLSTKFHSKVKAEWTRQYEEALRLRETGKSIVTPAAALAQWHQAQEDLLHAQSKLDLCTAERIERLLPQRRQAERAIDDAVAVCHTAVLPSRVQHNELVPQLLQLLAHEDVRSAMLAPDLYGIVGLWRLRRVCRSLHRYAKATLSTIPWRVLAMAPTPECYSRDVGALVGPAVEALDFSTLMWSPVQSLVPPLPILYAKSDGGIMPDNSPWSYQWRGSNFGRRVIVWPWTPMLQTQTLSSQGGKTLVNEACPALMHWQPGDEAWAVIPWAEDWQLEAAVELKDGRIMAVGCSRPHGTTGRRRSRVCLLDADGSKWTAQEDGMSWARNDVTLSVLPNGEVIAAGGFAANDEDYVDVAADAAAMYWETMYGDDEDFDQIYENQWFAKRWLPGDAVNTVECWSPVTESWTVLESFASVESTSDSDAQSAFPDRPPHHGGLAGGCSCILPSGRAIMMGGSCGLEEDVANAIDRVPDESAPRVFDPSRKSWTKTRYREADVDDDDEDEEQDEDERLRKRMILEMKSKDWLGGPMSGISVPGGCIAVCKQVVMLYDEESDVWLRLHDHHGEDGRQNPMTVVASVENESR